MVPGTPEGESVVCCFPRNRIENREKVLHLIKLFLNHKENVFVFFLLEK